VAQIFDADEEAGVTFIVMELVEGRTVGDLIKSGDWIAGHDRHSDASGGRAGQGARAGHRASDIKPANVMRTPEGT